MFCSTAPTFPSSPKFTTLPNSIAIHQSPNLNFSSTVKLFASSIMAKTGGGVNNAVMLTSGASGRINALFSLHALRSLFRLVSAFLLIFMLPFRHRSVIVSAESPEKSAGGGKEESSKKVVRIPAAMAIKRVVDKEVAIRRSLAIKRVVQGSGNDEETVRDFWLFNTSRGETIFTQSWTPVKLQIRGLVVILHGLNEHCGRYNDFAKKLNANGFKVYGMDWIGHDCVSFRKLSVPKSNM